MAYSYQEATYSSESVTTLAVSIAFLDSSHLHVYVNGSTTELSTSLWSCATGTITFSPTLTAVDSIVIRRVTPGADLPYVFDSGAFFGASNIDADFTWLIYASQEAAEAYDLAITAITAAETAAAASATAAAASATAAATSATAAATSATAAAASQAEALEASEACSVSQDAAAASQAAAALFRDAAAASEANALTSATAAAASATSATASESAAAASQVAAAASATSAAASAASAATSETNAAASATSAASSATSAATAATSAASTASEFADALTAVEAATTAANAVSSLIGNYKAYTGLSTNTTLSAANSGTAYLVGASGLTIILPTAAANLHYLLYAGYSFTLTLPSGALYGRFSSTGASSITVPEHACVEVICDGGNWELVGGFGIDTTTMDTISDNVSDLQTKVEDYGLYKPLLVAKKSTSASQTPTVGTATKLTFTAATDTAGGWSSTDNSYTVPVAGWYRVDTQVRLTANAVGNVYVMLYIAGVGAATMCASYISVSGLEAVLPGSMIVHCTAGQTIALWVNESASMTYSSYSDAVGLAATKLMITLERLD